MKLSVLFLMFLLVAFPCSSATQSEDVNVPAALPITWDLSAIADYYNVSFGFGQSYEENVSSIELIPLVEKAGELTASASSSIWWNITAPVKVELELLAGSDLSAAGVSGTIGWSVSWDEKDLSTNVTAKDNVTVTGGKAESGTNTSQTAVIHNGDPASASSSDYLPIKITTENAFDSIPADYSSTLTLSVVIGD